MFTQKVLKIVSKIPPGFFLSYKEVARRSGNPKAPRAVGQILAHNQNPSIPCHRVLRNDGEVGGYKGNRKNCWQKVALLLKEGALGVIPTDTLYGLCASALNPSAVEKVYLLRQRKPDKPMIILIASPKDLELFQVKLTREVEKIIKALWPGRVSLVLPLGRENFCYLHRGVQTLAFRLPAERELLEILKISGPLVAPSANIEGERPAETVSEAKRYFGRKVFYYDKGRLGGESSTLLDLTSTEPCLLRKGADFEKVNEVVNKVRKGEFKV